MKRFYKNYIQGAYHCDTCPYCWEERGYEDCDVGCYIFGDIRDTCRLLPPFRHIIGYFRKKKALYYYAHKYDGFADWYIEREKLQDHFNELFKRSLDGLKIYYRDLYGKWVPVEDDSWMLALTDRLYRFRSDYEDVAHPCIVKTLRQEWQDLIKKTWNRFVDQFKPYFCE